MEESCVGPGQHTTTFIESDLCRRHPSLHWVQKPWWAEPPSPPSPWTPSVSSCCQTLSYWREWMSCYHDNKNRQMSVSEAAAGCTCRSFMSFSKRSLSEVSASSSWEADSAVFRSSASSVDSSVIWGHTLRLTHMRRHGGFASMQCIPEVYIHPIKKQLSNWKPLVVCLPCSPVGHCSASARSSLSPSSPASVSAAESPPGRNTHSIRGELTNVVDGC